LSEYSIRVGSKVLPAKSPQNVTDFFCELLKSIGSFSNLSHETIIDLDNYDVPTSVANTETGSKISASSSSSSFMIGCDFESYAEADKSNIFVGTNTSNDEIYLNLIFKAGNSAVRHDCYALYDQVILAENGLLSVRY
jgi:hypothetical protein